MRRLLFAIFAVLPSPAFADVPPLAYRLDGYHDDQVTYESHLSAYEGRWVGTWYGADGRVYSGEFQGSFQGQARAQDGRAAAVAPSQGYSSPAPPVSVPPGGLIANGFYYPPPIVTTTVVEYRRVEQ